MLQFPTSLRSLWQPQEKAIALTKAARAAGHKRILLTLPTGAGKGRIACELIRDWLAEGLRVSLYTNRRMLLDQLSAVLTDFGLDHGVRAAGWRGHASPLQVSSIQTEHARRARGTHPADIAVVDEAHLQRGPTARAILDQHPIRLGLTATPIGLAHMYDHLIVGGTDSEMQVCGALVPVQHFGPTQPDLRKIRRLWRITADQIAAAMPAQTILGDVLEWFGRLNPQHKPTILFASGVAESRWFAEQFTKAGIPAAHLDGETCWFNGATKRSCRHTRNNLRRMFHTGEVKVITNRFVMREGIDLPNIEHMILATVFGSLQTYLQSVGRGRRASTGKDKLTIQDHGGNYHHHGSASMDRAWSLGVTEATAIMTRTEPRREPCPKCTAATGCECRPVLMEAGELVEHDQVLPGSDTEKWLEIYQLGRQLGLTFNVCEAQFWVRHRYYPPRTLPKMPVDPMDWGRSIKEVPVKRLTRSR